MYSFVYFHIMKVKWGLTLYTKTVETFFKISFMFHIRKKVIQGLEQHKGEKMIEFSFFLCELFLYLQGADRDKLFVNSILWYFLYKHSKNQVLCEV